MQEAEVVEDFLEYYKLESTYILADDVVPPQFDCNAQMLEVSSPRKEYWQRFAKRGAIRLYMPIWTFEELKRCRTLCFDVELTDVILAEKYRKFGGSVRYVLRLGKRDVDEDIVSGLNNSDLLKVVESEGQMGTPEDASSIILHWIVFDKNSSSEPSVDNVDKEAEDNEEGITDYLSLLIVELKCFDAYYCDFASPFIRHRAIQLLGKQLHVYFKEFVANTSGNIYFGQLRGRVFEDLAHQILLEGGNFSIRNLATEQRSTVVLEPEAIQVLESVEKIQQAPNNVYLQPQASNFGSVDAILKPSSLFQMMTGK